MLCTLSVSILITPLAARSCFFFYLSFNLTDPKVTLHFCKINFYLNSQKERERRRQHMTLIRQLENRRKYEERERKKHQVKRKISFTVDSTF